MQAWTFKVPSAPVPKARPRTGRGHTYTPERTKDAEQRVAMAFRQQIIGYGPPKKGRFGIGCQFYIQNDLPDLDNLMKTVMDGLNGIAYFDDRQVTRFLYTEKTIEKDKLLQRTEVTLMLLE